MLRFGLIVFLLVFFVAAGIAAPVRSSPSGSPAELTSGLDDSRIPTGILYDRAVPLSRIATHDGAPGAPPALPAHWRQMAFEINAASLTAPSWPNLGTVLHQTRSLVDRGIIPLVAMSFDYNRIRPGALEDGSLVIEDGRLVERGVDLYTRHTVHAVTALKDYTHRGEDVTFVLDRRWYLTNLERPIASV